MTRTSLGLLKEDERYDLDVTLVDRNGEPASGWVSVNIAGDPMGAWGEYVDGERTLRMPPGNYSLTAFLDVNGTTADRSGLAVLVDPETVLDHDAEVALDARNTRLLETTAPQRTEDRQRKVDLSITAENGQEFRSAYAVPPAVDDIYVSPTEAMTSGSFMFTTRWRKGEPMLGLGTPGGDRRVRDPRAAGQRARHRTRSATTLFAGNGSAADYAGHDAHGKVVVVHRSDEVAPEERPRQPPPPARPH